MSEHIPHGWNRVREEPSGRNVSQALQMRIKGSSCHFESPRYLRG
jgi:hypothetical protein